MALLVPLGGRSAVWSALEQVVRNVDNRWRPCSGVSRYVQSREYEDHVAMQQKLLSFTASK